jgi:hypothetical protein
MPRVPRVIILHAPPLALLAIVLTALVAGSGGAAPSRHLTEASPNACSLTSAQKRTAVLAFEAMMPTFRHPRCSNCHGGVNPSVDFSQGGHRGGAVTDPASCDDCHSLLPGWRVPGPVLHFTPRSNKELCIFFKQLFPGPGIFVEHIQFEPGSPHFIKQAFEGDKALNTLGEITLLENHGITARREPPPGSHAGLIQQATDWGTAVGRGWTSSPECGCELGGAWIGTVRAVGEFFGAIPGTLTVTSEATMVLERVPTPSYASGQGVEVYHSTLGTVRWDALASGGCRGNAGGTVPLDSIDVDGNPAMALRFEQVGSGTVSYQPTTGSMPDQWSPIFSVLCDIGGQTLTIPTTNLMPTWWQYEIMNPPTSTDVNRIRGSHLWIPAPGSRVLWEWDLERK